MIRAGGARRAGSERRRVAPFAIVASLVCGCNRIAPTRTEVLLNVDTDVAVPELADRLRFDIYDSRGTWRDTRDLPLASARDLPTGFSIVPDDETKEHDVFVRIRLYPDGFVRQYHGEKYVAPVFIEPRVAHTSTELCRDAAELTVGHSISLRRGATPVTAPLPVSGASGAACATTKSGAIAARFHPDRAGEYRFELTVTSHRYPDTSVLHAYGQPGGSLFLRTDCADPHSQLACVDSPMIDPLLGLNAQLSPGDYWIMASGSNSLEPADLVLSAARADDSAAGTAEGTPAAAEPATPETPRLLVDGRDVTPETEPLPSVTVDRLATFHIRPGERQTATVTLHGNCFGRMARVRSTSSGIAGESCTDDGAKLEPVVDLPRTDGIARLAKKTPATFGTGSSCSATSASVTSNDAVACVPGGAFLFGRESVGRTFNVRRFFLDRNEVTVREWRGAVSRGFVSPDPSSPVENPGTLLKSQSGVISRASETIDGLCTWSPSPIAPPDSREEYALTCLSWYAARAFCRFRGGDLPTSVQFEYAATVAGRQSPTLYPWGDSEPTCDREVIGRDDSLVSSATGGNKCLAAGKPYGPAPVTSALVSNALGDVTPNLGIVGLDGGVSEWALDSVLPLDDACWDAAPIDNPRCWEDEAPARVARGASWGFPVGFSYILTESSGLKAGAKTAYYGFRCAYDEAPQ